MYMYIILYQTRFCGLFPAGISNVQPRSALNIFTGSEVMADRYTGILPGAMHKTSKN